MHQSKVSLIIAAVALFVAESCFASQTESVRHKRYCEIVVGKGLQASIYSTFTLNNCPENVWRNLDAKSIKRRERATFVYLNGPRHFITDNYTSNNTNLFIKDFGGMQVKNVARVKIHISDIIKGFRPFIEHQLYRDMAWVYKSGAPVYELISPNHKVYVMQSYSDEIVKQNVTTLARLGSTLKLPKGWQFKTGTLANEEILSSQNDVAVVTQDNLKNTYQLAKKDFLG